jgi:hypothetical protein
MSEVHVQSMSSQRLAEILKNIDQRQLYQIVDVREPDELEILNIVNIFILGIIFGNLFEKIKCKNCFE